MQLAAEGFAVVMPDFYRGNPCDPDTISFSTPEGVAAFKAWVAQYPWTGHCENDVAKAVGVLRSKVLIHCTNKDL